MNRTARRNYHPFWRHRYFLTFGSINFTHSIWRHPTQIKEDFFNDWFKRWIFSEGTAFKFYAPHRNLMPPPKLPADAPILNIRQPVVIHLCPTVWIKLHL